MGEITAGDVVVLKSGSLPMTVMWIGRDGNTSVVWADTNGDHKTATYTLAALKKVDA